MIRRAGLLLLLLLVACGEVIAQPTPAPLTPSAVEASPAASPVAEATIPAETPPPTAVPLPVELPERPDPLPDTFSGASALYYAGVQMQWVPRDVGTPGWRATGDWIVSSLNALGWDVEERYFPVPEGNRARNIIARRGSGPLVLIGAHYDSRRYADADPDQTLRQQPVPAANDGASGVAVLMELARVLSADRLDEEVWLVFFDAEDNGDIGDWGWTLGSQELAQQLPQPPEAVVVLDMIGDADQQIYYETSSTPALREQLWSTAAELGYTTWVAEDRHSMLDDHTPFLEQGYPAVDVIDFDYPYWHTTGDTLDKLSADSLESIGRTVEVWLTEKR